MADPGSLAVLRVWDAEQREQPLPKSTPRALSPPRGDRSPFCTAMLATYYFPV